MIGPAGYAAVAAGSVLGGAARWLSVLLLAGWLGPGFPWGNLAVNAAGSFLIGLYAAAALGRATPRPQLDRFVMAGVCGGFTTFSIFSMEALGLFMEGRLGLAGLFVALSLLLWLGAVAAGYALGRRLGNQKPSTSRMP